MNFISTEVSSTLYAIHDNYRADRIVSIMRGLRQRQGVLSEVVGVNINIEVEPCCVKSNVLILASGSCGASYYGKEVQLPFHIHETALNRTPFARFRRKP